MKKILIENSEYKDSIEHNQVIAYHSNNDIIIDGEIWKKIFPSPEEIFFYHYNFYFDENSHSFHLWENITNDYNWFNQFPKQLVQWKDHRNNIDGLYVHEHLFTLICCKYIVVDDDYVYRK